MAAAVGVGVWVGGGGGGGGGGWRRGWGWAGGTSPVVVGTAAGNQAVLDADAEQPQ